jgi:hypothetical protein
MGMAMRKITAVPVMKKRGNGDVVKLLISAIDEGVCSVSLRKKYIQKSGMNIRI